MFGFKKRKAEEQPATPEDPRAAQPAPVKPEGRPEKKPHPLTDYASGGKTRRALQELGFKNGGVIQGPGTGTSDSIKKEIPKGSYIMPADSTEQIGADQMQDLGARVPVNVSNGEYELPPEQVHAVGVQALNQMRDATHTPVAEGFQPLEDGLFFANGGSPSEDELRRTGPSPQRGAIAQANERRVERMGGRGMYEQSNASLGAAARSAFPNTATAIQGAGQNIAESYDIGGLPAAVGATVRNTMVPAIGFAADLGRSAKIALDPAANALKTAVTGDATPIEGTRQAADAAARQAERQAVSTPPVAPQKPATRQGYGFTPAEQQGPALGMTARPTSAAGINRIDNAPGLGSPLFTNVPAGQAVSEMQSKGQMSSADLATGNERMARANAIRQEYLDSFGGPKAASIGNSAVEETNARFRESRLQESMRGAGRSRAGAIASMRNADLQREQAREELGFRASEGRANRELTAQTEEGRLSVDRDRLGLDRARTATDLEARGFDIRNARRIEDIQARLEKAESPEDRAALSEQLRALTGREMPNRFTVVPGGQEISPQGMAYTRPSMVFNNQTGQFVDQRGVQSLPPIAENPAVQEIMQNTKLSREERAAQIRALGYR